MEEARHFLAKLSRLIREHTGHTVIFGISQEKDGEDARRQWGDQKEGMEGIY